MRELLYLASPRRAIYSEAFGGWTDMASKEVVGGRMFVLLQRALSRCGLRGVSSTLGFMVTAQLHRFVKEYHAIAQGEVLATLDRLHDSLAPTSTLPERPLKLYTAAATTCQKLLAEVHETVWRCGVGQLLRAHAASTLLGSTEIDCHLLHSVLSAADAALLAEMRHVPAAEGSAPPGVQGPGAQGSAAALATGAADELAAGTEAASDLSAYLEAAGLSRPKEQV